MRDADQRAMPESTGGRSAAFFDVDGTIVSTHIVHQYLFVRRSLAARRGFVVQRAIHPVWTAAFMLKCLHYLWLDRVSRTRMNIAFYRNYGGLDAGLVRATAADCFTRVLAPNIFPPAAECIAEHLSRGRRVVLVTGSIDFLIAPLASHLAKSNGGGTVDLVARTLTERGGVLTGNLNGPPIGGDEKAVEMRKYAAQFGVDLADCYAYGDSIADLPMLELVGHPFAVNADKNLDRVAASRSWPRLDWRNAVRAT